MEALTNLREKIELLIELVKKLKAENEEMHKEKEVLFMQNEELKVENAKFAEDSAQIAAQLKSLEDTFIKESDQLKELSQERIEAKTAVEDLLKSIDTFVEQEV